MSFEKCVAAFCAKITELALFLRELDIGCRLLLRDISVNSSCKAVVVLCELFKLY